MSETWAGLVREAADDIDGEFGAGWRTSVVKLRRLASLLEQITPEMAEGLRQEARYQHVADDGDEDVATLQNTVASLLSALSTAPTEETEDR